MGQAIIVSTRDGLYSRLLGEFVVRDRIDEGGFGAVYESQQLLLGRKAVVKVLHKHLTDDANVARFKREAQLASQFDHPYAAHVYAFGVEPADGLAWIAMEMVYGTTLEAWLKRYGPMPIEQFVPFFERVAAVVHAAHERGIVHRDLKPSNIMIVEEAGELLPKLLDFGVAKRLGDTAVDTDDEGDNRPGLGMFGLIDNRLTPWSSVVGTPPWIAPESWYGTQAGPAADLYALGVIAFECLTGRRPFRAETLAELRDQHCRGTVPVVGGSLPSDLDAVFQRALAKEPADRYVTPNQFAAALHAVADAQPLAQVRRAAQAWDSRGRPDGLLWRGSMLAELERWMLRTSRKSSETEIAFVEASREAERKVATEVTRKRWRDVRIGIGVALAGVTAIVAITVGHVEYERRITEQHLEDAKETARRTTLTSELEQGRAALLHDDLAEARLHLGAAWTMGERDGSTAFMFARALQPQRAELARLQGTGRMWSAAWSPDGTRIVTTDDHGAQIWSADTYQSTIALPHRDVVYQAAWINSDTLATACGDGSVRIWNAATGDLVKELRLPDRTPRWYALAVHGHLTAAVDAKGTVAALWDAQGTPLAIPLSGDNWPSVAFSSDGRWLAVSGGGPTVIVDTRTRRRVTVGTHALSLAWDPTGPRLLTGSASGDVSIWAPTGVRVHRVRESGDPADVVAWSTDGKRIAQGLRNGTVLVFDALSNKLVSSNAGSGDKIVSLEFSADGRQLAVASTTGAIAALETSSSMPLIAFDLGASARSAHFLGDRLLAASWDGARVWAARSPYRQWSKERLTGVCGLVGDVEPDGRYVAVSCEGYATRIWDTLGDAVVVDLPAMEAAADAERVPYPAVSTRGDQAAIARGQTAEVYEVPSGRLLRTVRHSAGITALAFDAAGSLLSGSSDGVVHVTRDDSTVASEAAADAAIDALIALPDGRLVVADARGRIRVANEEIDIGIRARMLRPSGSQLLVVPYYKERVEPMALVDISLGTATRLDGPQAFSARWVSGGILSAHADGSVRLWSPDGKLRQTYHGAPRFLAAADMSPDGSMVVAGGGDGLLRFWDTSSGRPLWVVPAHRPYVMGVRFQSGADLVTRGTGGDTARWRIPDARSVINVR